jgi:hypothetical protein
MSNARNLANLLGTSTKANQTISTSGAITTTGAFTSKGIDDNADATAITIDSAENVGIGQAPETGHHANWTAVDFGNRGGIAQYKTTGDVSLSYNLYHDGAWKAKENDTSARYAMGNSPHHIWYTGASASADGAVTLTERMRLTAEGLHLGGTGSANALNDYEEGTFTFGTNANVAFVSNSNLGKYTKIGRMVHLQFMIDVSSVSGTNHFYMSGMPFPQDANDTNTLNGYSVSAVVFYNFDTYYTGSQVMARMENQSSNMYFYESYDSVNTLIASNTRATNSTEIFVSHTYFTST